MMIREGRKPELAAFGNEVTVQVLRQNLSVRAPFMHGCGIRRNGKSQEARLIPNFDRLNE
jgi:hypothetical protein